MSDWFIRLGYEGQLAIWLVASFLLYTLGSQTAWHSQWPYAGEFFSGKAPTRYQTPDRYQRRRDRLGRLIERIRDHPLAPAVEEAIRLIYYLGIPFMAAVNGLVGADSLGISGTDWIDGHSAQGFRWEDWARGLGLATAAVLAMIGLWFVGRLVSRRAELTPVTQGIYSPFWQRLLGVLYDQAHWAFYRSGPILWLDDLYWGTFAGLALVLLEAGLNPALRWSLRNPETAGPALIRLGMAWISALLFLATQNLWLTLGAHLALVTLLWGQDRQAELRVDGSAK